MGTVFIAVGGEVFLCKSRGKDGVRAHLDRLTKPVFEEPPANETAAYGHEGLVDI
jgi:hypothetical protein